MNNGSNGVVLARSGTPAIVKPRVVLVVNPRAIAGVDAALWQRLRELLRRGGVVGAEMETHGDGANGDRIARLVIETDADTVVAAGGDGTVSDVVGGLMRAGSSPMPALAIIPTGTANNVARALGLRSVRQDGAAAVERAVAAMFDGALRRIDLGEVRSDGDVRYFVGSFAIGMDADILVTRNRTRERLPVGRRLGGYPLYLASCAVNLLRGHGATARLHVDGAPRTTRAYNVLITNTPLYAGEFRFGADNAGEDGRLDLHVFTGVLDYLRRYPAAWRLHVRHDRGERVDAPRETQPMRELLVELPTPVACQLDGEEGTSAARYEVRVVPQVLAVRVPA